MIIIVTVYLFGMYYTYLPGYKHCHWVLITHISLAKDCQTMPRLYLAILGNMYNKHRKVPVNSHTKVVYKRIHIHGMWKYTYLQAWED